ncbi:MAG: carbamate kinase [Coriobacteriia bacterium]|nr:carbamate kinase [Coriobacteriia bacterium]
MSARSDTTLVIALGGNALARFGDDGTVAAQYERAAQAMSAVADLATDGWRTVVTHGNGPVIGAIVLRGELAGALVPPTPLYISGADSEGGIGLMLQQVLGNELRARGVTTTVATVVTQVVVDRADPAFAHPTKPIGTYYDDEAAEQLRDRHGWMLAKEPGRGWRRLVASPCPQRVVETLAISTLLQAGILPIAAGGGGVPVFEDESGALTGIDAVIDKDRTAALLAHALGARMLAIVMEQDAVYTEFGTRHARRIEQLDAHEAVALSARSPEGSIGPKLQAAGWFAERGGTTVICSAENLSVALAGQAGTRVGGA